MHAMRAPCTQGVFSHAVWHVTGHESDARVLQQQLSKLVSQQQEAQQYVKDNPPPEIPAHEQQQSAKLSTSPNTTVDWKWDILRPVNIAEGSK